MKAYQINGSGTGTEAVNYSDVHGQLYSELSSCDAILPIPV